MAIVELGDRIYMVPGGVNVGVLRGDDGRCVLIDTGLNETSAKKVLKAVREELHGEVVVVLVTHGHADHFGGNATVVKRTGARVYAPTLDEAILRYPLLQPALLFAGADPPDSMRGSFMLAEPSPVDEVIEGDRLVLEGFTIDVVSLKGHSPNQLGFRVGDVFFCADIVLPETVLEKYKIPYLFSARDHITSLERCTDTACRVAVPGHGPMLDGLTPLRNQNLALVRDVAERIVALCEQPRSGDAILGELLRSYGAQANDAPAYYLLHPTVYAFLAHLEREGKVAHRITSGESLWQAC